tara:strand:+ start:166 stop:684 length:519 start_codon:yes stop_codon:yes gene_type:complete
MLVITLLVLWLPIALLYAFSSKSVAFKRGRNVNQAFFFGFFLQGLGLIITFLLPKKIKTEEKRNKTKIILYALGRFVLFAILHQILVVETLGENNLYKMFEWYSISIGSLWTLRGKYILDFKAKKDEAVNEEQPSKENESVADELIKLNELKEKGLLTEEEFNEQKKKLLKQ